MIQKLRRKFICITMLLVSLVLAVAFAAIYITTARSLENESYTYMRSLLSSESVPNPWGIGSDFAKGQLPTSLRTLTVRVNGFGRVQEISENGIAVNDYEALSALVEACLSAEDERGVIQNGQFRFLVQRGFKDTFIIFADRSAEDLSLKLLVRTSLVVALGCLVAFFIISIYLARWAVRPIEKSWQQQRQFVSDASHELKTPITVILANTGILLSHKDETVASQEKWVHYIEDEAHRLHTLVQNMLTLARSDDESQPQQSYLPLSFSELVTGAVLPFEALAFEQHKSLDSQVTPNIVVKGDSGQLSQMVAALLDNACKYSDAGGAITLRLALEKGQAILTVANTGNAIPPQHLPHLFERFYRADPSRTDRTGAGLGLSIVKEIVTAHGGAISVESTETDGTTFRVSLPAAT